MASVAFPTLLAALLLAAVHLATPSLRFLHGTPRSSWLSLAGGVSVAYVFVHLLPELAEGQARLGQLAEEGALPGFAERHVYLIALVGLAVFYGLDRFAKVSLGRHGGDAAGSRRDDAEQDADRNDVRTDDGRARSADGVFWVHITSFAFYNVLVGYLLNHREGEGADTGALAFFAVAMALHFVVTDYALHAHHQSVYRRIGRWLLAAAALGGWALGSVTTLSEATIAVLTAFLAGGVILNVLKEEVPNDQRSRFWAFAGGMAGYAALLLAL